MAKSLQQNGITFSNYNNTDVTPVGATIRLGTNEGLDTDNFGIVNAVDIAWNGAQLGTVNGINFGTINTTGDLMNALKKLANAISSGGGTTPTTYYTITYNSNNGTWQSQSDPQTYSIASGDSHTVLSGNVVTRSNTSTTGYNFAGWNTQANGNGTTYNAGQVIYPTTNMTLYAKWASYEIPTSCTVTFNSNGGNAVSSQTVSAGTSISLPTPTKSSSNYNVRYSFAGWRVSGSSSYVNMQYNVTSDVTLVADWTTELKIILSLYYGPGSTYNSNPNYVERWVSSSNKKLPTGLTSLTETGYQFSGWTNPQNQLTTQANEPFSIPTPEQNYTTALGYTAVWTQTTTSTDKYWFGTLYGMENPTDAMIESNGVVASSPITNLTYNFEGQGDYLFYVYPASWGTANILDKDNDSAGFDDATNEDWNELDKTKWHMSFKNNNGMLNGFELNISYN